MKIMLNLREREDLPGIAALASDGQRATLETPLVSEHLLKSENDYRHSSEQMALVCVGFFALNLLGVILALPTTEALTIKFVLFVMNCVGVVVFAILSAKFIIESCRQS